MGDDKNETYKIFFRWKSTKSLNFFEIFSTFERFKLSRLSVSYHLAPEFLSKFRNELSRDENEKFNQYLKQKMRAQPSHRTIFLIVDDISFFIADSDSQ